MPIPESQLSTWSNRGADTTAQSTHQSIRNALENSQQLEKKSFDAFLQGSYRNATNVRADSDVDLVVKLNGIFVPAAAQYERTYVADTSKLRSDQQTLYRRNHVDASYGWSAFRADVIGALRDRFGQSSIEEGKKAIKVAKAPGRLAADVVVALEYRLYTSYRGKDETSQDYIEGIWFQERTTGRQIVNYPSQHFPVR